MRSSLDAPGQGFTGLPLSIATGPADKAVLGEDWVVTQISFGWHWSIYYFRLTFPAGLGFHWPGFSPAGVSGSSPARQLNHGGRLNPGTPPGDGKVAVREDRRPWACHFPYSLYLYKAGLSLAPRPRTVAATLR